MKTEAPRKPSTDFILEKLFDGILEVEKWQSDNFGEFCQLLDTNIKFLSESLICFRFISYRSKYHLKSNQYLRNILLNKFAIQHYIINPSLLAWQLHSIALLYDKFNLDIEYNIARNLMNFYGSTDDCAPIHRNEECKFLISIINKTPYESAYESTGSRFYCLNHDQIYTYAHLLFYSNSYGSVKLYAEPETIISLEFLLVHAYKSKNADMMIELLINYQSIDGLEDGRVAIFSRMLEKIILDDVNFSIFLKSGFCENFEHIYHQSLLYAMLVESSFYRPESIDIDKTQLKHILESYRFFSCLHDSNYVKAARKYFHVLSQMRGHTRYDSFYDVYKSHFNSYIERQKLLASL
jgi:hypothetical protein